MTESTVPPQRPALQKAADHGHHPALPKAEPVRELTTRAGSNTADAVVGEKDDKLVRLDIRVPKALRKRLRKEAEQRGMTVDELVAALLRDRTFG